MAFWKIPIYLNIRQKIMIALTISVSAIGVVGGFSYHYLQAIEVKQRFVETVDDLRNVILEMRRYEKNYLLYGSLADLEEHRRYIKQALEMLETISPEVEKLEAAPKLEQLRREFAAYRKLMDQVRPHSPGGSPPLDLQKLEEQLRERGRALVELSQSLVTFEREKILKIIRTLKVQLLFSLAIFFPLGGFLIFIISRKVIQPLRVIEKTTLRIAGGNFKPLPVLDTRDETQRVVEAFNRMIQELGKRQDQLVQAKKMASLGILTAGIAHQLNNPLNNISTSCQILLEELGQCEVDFLKKMLTTMEQEVNRARDIVKGLLEFSRAREFTLKPIPLEDVVTRSIKFISSQVPPGIDVVHQVPWDLVIHMDAQQMQEALLNLLMNAIQAIEEPPGEVRITAQVDHKKQEAVITVEDTGVGIPQEDLPYIFDPFFSTKEAGGGTGLGLSIVYGIVEKHQGSVNVESKAGEGTRFTIRLPLQPAVEPRRVSA